MTIDIIFKVYIDMPLSIHMGMHISVHSDIIIGIRLVVSIDKLPNMHIIGMSFDMIIALIHVGITIFFVRILFH